jgi:hypothetical protein
MEPLGPALRWLIALQPQAERMRRVEEEVLRGVRKDDVRVTQIKRHIPLAGVLLLEGRREPLRVVERLPKQEASPTTVHDGVYLRHLVVTVARLPAGDRGRSRALQPLMHTLQPVMSMIVGAHCSSSLFKSRYHGQGLVPTPRESDE